MNELNSLTCPLDGAHLVEAAAGTGKTYNIQNLVVRLLLERDFAINNIAVVTYTEAAADELRLRLRKVINSTCEAAAGTSADARAGDLVETALKSGISREEIIFRLKCACQDFDLAEIGTIHSFCRRLLKDFAFESGEAFQLELLNDHGKMRNDFAMDAYRSLCYQGKFAALNAVTLNIDFLQDMTARKDAHPDVVIVPAPRGDSPDDAAEHLLEKWQIFKEQPEKYTLLQSLKGKTKAGFDPDDLINAFHTADSKKLPAPADMDILRKILPESLRSDKIILKKCKDELEVILQDHRETLLLTKEVILAHEEYQASLRDEAIRRTLEQYNKFKDKLNLITFDDILRKTSEALNNTAFSEAVRKRLKAGIIDEFQDTDPVQWKIFRALFGDRTMFLVGDPRQAIYGFRGGDISAYLAARETIAQENRHTLTTNYRSCPGLLREINTCFGKHVSGFATQQIVLPEVTPPENAVHPLLIDGKEDEKPFKIIQTDKSSLSDTVVDTVVHLLTADNIRIPEKENSSFRKIRPDDIAILVRGWHSGIDLKQRLALKNIPAVTMNTGNVFATESAESLQRVLEGILNITDNSAVRLALTTPICGLTFDDLTQQSEKVPEKTAVLAKAGKLWRQKSFYAMFKQLLADFDVELRYTRKADGLRELTDLIQLGDLLHQENSKRHPAPEMLLDFLIYNRSRPTSEQYPREQETDSGAVIITTEHSSKGLQYPIVLLPDLNNKTKNAKIYRKNNVLTAGEENGCDAAYATDEQLMEELRLTYVAMTRAEQACYIFTIPPNAKKNNRVTPVNWLWFNRQQPLIPGVNLSTRLESCTQLNDLPQELLEERPGNIQPYTPVRSGSPLAAQEITGIPGIRITTSFTGMAPSHSGHAFTSPDPDELDDEENDPEDIVSAPPDPSPLRRLRGKTFGLLLHGVMETLDFKSSDETIREKVEREIQLSDPTEAELDYASKIISNTLHLKLPDGPVISDIPAEKRCAEMKFHFCFDSALNKGKIRTAAAAHLKEDHHTREDDSDTYQGGFITGSIDLLFEYGGKYFILDWKSNHLPDYSPLTIRQSMVNSYYQMQYLIYLTALMRFLKQRLSLPEFGEKEYEKYIGGAYYIYMRGTDPAAPSNGVFFDRPSYSEINKLAGLLI